MNTCMRFLIPVVLCMALNACAGVGYQNYILPVPSDGWEAEKELKIDKYSITYRCDTYAVNVAEVHVNGMLLFAGPLVPIIPLPLPTLGYDNVTIFLFVKGNGPTPDKDSLSISLSNCGDIKPTICEKVYDKNDRYFKFVFPVKSKQLEEFKLNFYAPFYECKLPSLTFKAKLSIEGGITVPGP